MSTRFGLLLLLAQLSWGQKDPLNDFCRRFGHQTAVVDQKLYIDGGLVDWNPISQNPNNYSNPWLLYNDLTTSPGGIAVPQLHANLSKNSSMPDVSGGVLWPDAVNKRFYLYGGDYPSDIAPNNPQLLSYDILYNQWENFGTPEAGIESVSWGAGVGISELGQGYVLGGWLSNNSVPGWAGSPLATSTLIEYQMDSGAWTNSTGPDTTPRAEGVMVYLPASENGLLVYFGGLTQPYLNATTVPSPMNMIYLYDIQSSKWYSQTAFGDVPDARRRFCAGAAWAPDHSSYNIYLYGGLGFGDNVTGFDDVYILSLPSFQWVKWWEGSGTGKPHHSLTCNVVNSGQMLIIGGSFPLSSDCDSPSTWGTHNMDLGKQSGNIWNDYEVNVTSYVVPPEIISVVGGSSLGGATATAPAGGFNNADLAVYFTQKVTAASRTPTRSIPSATPTNSTSTPTTSTSSSRSKKLSTGAIVGIAIGGAAFIVFLALGAYCLKRHRRKNARNSQPPGVGGVPYPAPGYSQVPISPQSFPQSPYTNTLTGTSTGGYSPEQEQYSQMASMTAVQPAELSGAPLSMHQIDPKDSIFNQQTQGVGVQVSEVSGNEIAGGRNGLPYQMPYNNTGNTWPILSPTSAGGRASGMGSPLGTESALSSPVVVGSNAVPIIYDRGASERGHTSPAPTYESLGRARRDRGREGEMF